MYGGTLGAYPSGYAGARPGPDLYGSSVVALNATNGKMIWFYQGSTHDGPGDQDCEWGTVLTVVNGHKEIAAGCHWYLYGLDAASGKLLWSYDPINNKATHTTPTQYPGIGINMGDQMNMTLPYPYAPSGKYLINYSVSETIPTWDGKDTVFYWSDMNTFGGFFNLGCANGPPTNTTVLPFRDYSAVAGLQWCSFSTSLPQFSNLVAINETTGNIEWSHTYPNVLIRSGLTYTIGMLFAATNDGKLRVYNARTGDLVMSRYMGVALNYTPTIGATADGTIMAFLPVGGGILW